jgi:hypothetical protein
MLAECLASTDYVLRNWTTLQYVCYQRRSVSANIYICAAKLVNCRPRSIKTTRLLRAMIFGNTIYTKLLKFGISVVDTRAWHSSYAK